VKSNSFLKQIEKKKLFLYLFSFFIYLFVNNLVTSLINIPLRGELKLNLYGGHHIPCDINDLYVYLISFFLLNVVFCLVMVFAHLKDKNTFRSLFYLDILFCYLMYDLAVAGFWVLYYFSLVHIKLLGIFFSNPETIFEHDIQYSSLMFSCFWSVTLFVLLYKNNKLNFWFIIKRVVFLPFSILLFALIEKVAFQVF